MKFYIKSSYLGDEEKDLIKEYPCLKEYGFEVEKIIHKFEHGYVKDENGNKLALEHQRTYFKPYIFIDNLDQLMKLMKDVEVDLIISESYIEIYDGYRE